MKSFQLSRRGPDTLGLGVSGRRYWFRMRRKIALLSAHSATLLRLLFLLLASVFMGVGGVTNGGLLGQTAAMLAITIPVGWVSSLVWSYVLSLILLPLVYLAERLIAEPIRRDTMGWIAGSAVAIVGSVGWGLLPFVQMRMLGATPAWGAALSGDFVWILAAQVFSAVLILAAAQAGGYLGSMSALRRRRRLTEAGSVRFTVWRLLAVTAILSIMMSLLRLAGEFAVPLIVSILVSSLVAWAIHRPVAWATNRWLDWRLAKRRAKRAKARLTPWASPRARTSS